VTRRLRPAIAATGLLLLGCGETVFRSGLPAGGAPLGYTERWHDSLFFGTVESRRPEPLGSICPRGWSEVRISSSFLAGLLAWSTLGIYTPTEVTVVCAAPSGIYTGAPGEVPLAQPCR